MSTRSILITLICVFALPLASVCADEELPTTPKAFEERAAVLLGVEQDPDGVLALARKVLHAHAGERPWAVALLNAAVRAGEADHRVVALNLLQLLTGDQGKALEEADQARVQSALRRWGQTGGAPELADPLTFDFTNQPSPLERKVREIFVPLATATKPGEVSEARSAVKKALEDAGPEIFPVLAKIADDSPGNVGRVAAEILAAWGMENALPHLDRLLASKDAMTRGAAIRGLRSLPSSLEQTWFERYGGWLSRAESSLRADERLLLVEVVLTARMKGDELWARYQRGGLFADLFLEQLADSGDTRGYAEMLRRMPALEEEERDRFASTILRYSSGGHANALRPALKGLPIESMRAVVLSALGNNFGQAQNVGWLLSEWEADDSSHRSLRREIWKLAVPRVAKGHGAHSSLLSRLASHDGPPDKSLFEDEAWRNEFFQAFRRIYSGSRLVQFCQEHPKVFDQLLAYMPKLSPGARRELMQGMRRDGLPTSLQWSRIIELDPFARAGTSQRGYADWIVGEMARSQDPATWPWVEKHIEATGYPNHTYQAVEYLLGWKGAETLAFCERALSTRGELGTNMRTAVLGLLEVSYDQGGRAVLVRIASDPERAGASVAIKELARHDERELLAGFYQRALEGGATLPHNWRNALIQTANDKMQLEAVPFLLEEYRRNPGSWVAAVLDKLKKHRDRLASFENWREEEGRAAVNELLAQLESEDAAERGIAILALAALREQRAVPKFAKLALKDPHNVIRAQAREALQALAGLPK